jgi:hypothetical protein
MPDPTHSEPDAPASPLVVASNLEDAADLLLIHGRCKGTGVNGEDQFCVMHAIAVAKGTLPQIVPSGSTTKPAEAWVVECFGPEAAALSASLDVRFGSNPIDRCWGWNDMISDDFEVIDHLRLVAKDLRNNAIGDAGARDATRGNVGQADG